jgi:hypothetical protein
VKRFIFFIVALQIISSGNLFSELLKLDDLYQHYQEHKNSEQPLSVSQFIQSHYFDTVHENADPVKHAKLPLRQSGHSFVQVYHIPVEAFSLGLILVDARADFNPVSKGFLPQCNDYAIFQPPRTV